MLHVTDHRRRRFLQYNFMDPGWGDRISYGRARPPWPLRPAGAGAGDTNHIRDAVSVSGFYPDYGSPTTADFDEIWCRDAYDRDELSKL